MPPDHIKDKKRWEKAKEIVKKQYGKTEADGEEFYELVTGVYKQARGTIHKQGKGTYYHHRRGGKDKKRKLKEGRKTAPKSRKGLFINLEKGVDAMQSQKDKDIMKCKISKAVEEELELEHGEYGKKSQREKAKRLQKGLDKKSDFDSYYSDIEKSLLSLQSKEEKTSYEKEEERVLEKAVGFMQKIYGIIGGQPVSKSIDLEKSRKDDLPPGGVWRTIRGARVYIKDGKVLAGAEGNLTGEGLGAAQASLDDEDKARKKAKKETAKKKKEQSKKKGKVDKATEVKDLTTKGIGSPKKVAKNISERVERDKHLTKSNIRTAGYNIAQGAMPTAIGKHHSVWEKFSKVNKDAPDTGFFNEHGLAPSGADERATMKDDATGREYDHVSNDNFVTEKDGYMQGVVGYSIWKDKDSGKSVVDVNEIHAAPWNEMKDGLYSNVKNSLLDKVVDKADADHLMVNVDTDKEVTSYFKSKLGDKIDDYVTAKDDDGVRHLEIPINALKG